jgi:hypothetical protein
LGDKYWFFVDKYYIKLIRGIDIAHVDHEGVKKDELETLNLLTDKFSSLGKGKAKSSKPDKHHHSGKSDWKKKPFELHANSKLADTSSRMHDKTHTNFMFPSLASQLTS